MPYNCVGEERGPAYLTDIGPKTKVIVDDLVMPQLSLSLRLVPIKLLQRSSIDGHQKDVVCQEGSSRDAQNKGKNGNHQKLYTLASCLNRQDLVVACPQRRDPRGTDECTSSQISSCRRVAKRKIQRTRPWRRESQKNL